MATQEERYVNRGVHVSKSPPWAGSTPLACDLALSLIFPWGGAGAP